MAGIIISDDCLQQWERMKFKKDDFNYMIFHIVDYKSIQVKDCGKLPYDSFVAKFEPDNCCFAVVQIPMTTKLVFILWAPSTSSIRDRTIYASTCLDLSSQLGGFSKTIQATEQKDITLDNLKVFCNIRENNYIKTSAVSGF